MKKKRKKVLRETDKIATERNNSSLDLVQAYSKFVWWFLAGHCVLSYHKYLAFILQHLKQTACGQITQHDVGLISPDVLHTEEKSHSKQNYCVLF